MEGANRAQNKHIFGLTPVSWLGLVLFLALTACFYYFTRNAISGRETALSWLQNSWDDANDYKHGWMVPLLSLYMLAQACRDMKGIALRPSLHGLWFMVLGILLALISVRTFQPRVALGGAPFLLTGAVWYYWGWQVARRCAFPIFFLWLCIPLPGFQQATVWMQLLATQVAHWGARLFGVETVVEGTSIASASGQWDAYSVSGGCSGMRSLMALVMISFAWGYLASGLALWKRLTLALSAIPLAIIANAFRVTSIFVCAEYVNPAFAGKTWHDWSGLLFFFPASLIGLMLLHAALAGEIPLRKKRRVISRRNRPQAPEGGKEDSP